MKIQVTAEDIKNGIPGNTDRCPIARAVRRSAGPGCASVCIAPIIELHTSEGRSLYFAPQCVTDFINLFDSSASRHQAAPFEFELEKPYWSSLP